MSKIRVGINGFGRIGRLVFRAGLGNPRNGGKEGGGGSASES